MRLSLSKILLLVAAVYPLVVFFFFPKWVVDDAYITYRYADNLANYGQLTWNVGEEPVDGNTGLVWPVILAVLMRLGVSPITASHVLGVISFFIGELMLWLMLRRLQVPPGLRALPVVFFAASPILFTHALSGMETMLFLAALLTLFYLLAAVLARPTIVWPTTISFLVISFVISFIRPEGVLLAGLALAAVAYHVSRSDRAHFRHFVLAVLFLYIVPVAGGAWWQFHYYGSVLPNTYYVKTATGFTISYLVDFLRFCFRLLFAPVLAALLLLLTDLDSVWVRLKQQMNQDHSRAAALIIAVGGLFVLANLVQFLHAHLTVNFAYRFYVPLFLIAWIIVGIILGIGWEAFQTSRATQPLRYRAIVVVLVGLFGLQFLFYLLKLPEEMAFARDQIILQDKEHNLIGQTLRQIVPPTEWLVVYMDAGAIPYFSGLRTLDFGALNDKTLARQHLTPSARIDYLFSVHPGVIVFSSTESDRVDYGVEAEAIMQDPRFQNYILFKVYTTGVPAINYNEFVYLRKDLMKRSV